MAISVQKWFSINASKIAKSIAFYPAIIATAFLVLSYAMLYLDFSDFGKNIKSNTSWITIADANTARSIISTIAAAIISLAVFSFSMVMIVLNQAASHMSNRVLNSMIANRFQQIVLGFYIGTIVYSLFLLTTIKDISSGIYVPVLSIYLLILLTVVDIFLFIYFLNYVTQTVKYETVINRVWKKTHETLEGECAEKKDTELDWELMPFLYLKASRSDYFQNLQIDNLLKIAKLHNLYFKFLQKKGHFTLKNSNYLQIYGSNDLTEEIKEQIIDAVNFFSGQPIEKNAAYGFTQLTEVALKALSPGINDPATAIIALNALSDLLSYKMNNDSISQYKDDKDVVRIDVPTLGFTEFFQVCILPIWHYGKEDLQIQAAMSRLTNDLLATCNNKDAHLYLHHFLKIIEKDILKFTTQGI